MAEALILDSEALNALANIAFLAAYPLWSAIMIAVDILVIWAITVHGREMRANRT